MSLLPRLTRGSDNLDTPEGALLPLLPYLPHSIWEMCPGRGVMVELLRKHGFEVDAFYEIDSLTFHPNHPWDVSVTNPPFSKKAQFIARCNALGKPWALLLPITTLGSRKCQVNLDGVGILLLPKRIDFTGGRAPWFAVAWFGHGLGFDGRIILP